MTKYTDLITSEHAPRPKFVAAVRAATDVAVDQQSALASLPAMFDLDTAVGAQLDVIGEWVGISRSVKVPIVGVYFTFGSATLGFGAGYWKGPFDPDQGLTQLPDTSYRLLIRATIALNHWDGTMGAAVAAIQPIFPANLVYVQDNQNMTMTVAVFGPALDPISRSLLVGGSLALKPGAVRINYVFPSVANTPIFGFGLDNANIGGFGHGSWGTVTP